MEEGEDGDAANPGADGGDDVDAVLAPPPFDGPPRAEQPAAPT